MQFMAGCLTRSESDAWVRQAREALSRHGFGPWALELKAAGRFIGCVGLALCTFEAPFTPCVEILWRLQRSSWEHGYADEAARAGLPSTPGGLLRSASPEAGAPLAAAWTVLLEGVQRVRRPAVGLR